MSNMLLVVGVDVRDQGDTWARFAVIRYDQNSGQWVFSARQWRNMASSYICQLQTGQFKYDCIQFLLDSCYCIASVIIVNFICSGYSDRISN